MEKMIRKKKAEAEKAKQIIRMTKEQVTKFD